MFHSAGSKVAFSAEDARSAPTLSPLGFFDPSGERRFHVWHLQFSFANAPQRDDVATWTIAIEYHPWFVPQKGIGPLSAIHPFIVSRPQGPANFFSTTGYGVIFPTWWLILLLALPAAATAMSAIKSRTSRRIRGFPVVSAGL